MNPTLKRIYLGIAVLWLIYAGLVTCTLLAWGQSPWVSKQLWSALFAAMAFGVIACRLKQQAAINLLLVLGSLLFVEAALQVIGWMGLLPGVNAKNKCPYGRVYWSREGLGNSIRNRFGWYYPEFNTSARRKIALVGDSFVEAVEIQPGKNEGVILEKLLRESGKDTAVLAFGNHGTSLAYHLEVIDYAARHFHPDEVVLCIYLGNDVTESSPALNLLPAQGYMYYALDAEKGLVLNPDSQKVRDRFVRGLEFSHRSPLFTLSATLSSHVMSVQTLLSLRDNLERRRAQIPVAAGDPNDLVATQVRAIGLNPRVFHVPPDDEVEHAMSVLLRSIAACREVCATNGVKMRLVTIPLFPNVFYATQKGRDWTLRLEQYDFQAPERQIGAFARSNGIQVLELGEYMKSKRLEVAEIQKLYLSNGAGHFSEAGHRFFAEALFNSFYRAEKN